MKFLLRKPTFFLPYLVILSAILVGSLTLCSKKKPGFSLDKVKSTYEYSNKWVVDPPSPVEMLEIKKVLNQDFNYLGSGAECYAFLSSDGNYVLKFFKMKRLVPKTWLKYLPLPGLEKYRFNKIDKRILRHQELFTSYKMAYEELKDETGLIYLHLNKSKELDITVKLFDRMRKFEEVNLDEFEFVLQRKAQLIRDYITGRMQRGDKEGAIKAIEDLLKNVIVQCKKGFIDQDSGISHNFGFVGDKVIHFDVGRIERDEGAKDPTHYQREVIRVGAKLNEWLSTHYPSLVPGLETSINAMIDLPNDEDQTR